MFFTFIVPLPCADETELKIKPWIPSPVTVWGSNARAVFCGVFLRPSAPAAARGSGSPLHCQTWLMVPREESTGGKRLRLAHEKGAGTPHTFPKCSAHRSLVFPCSCNDLSHSTQSQSDDVAKSETHCDLRVRMFVGLERVEVQGLATRDQSRSC